jgi:hypothetical protein
LSQFLAEVDVINVVRDGVDFCLRLTRKRVFEKTGRARTPLNSLATPSPHSEFISMFSVRAVVRQAATVSIVARNVAAKRSIHSSPAALSDHLFVV